MQSIDPNISRSSVYRSFVREGISKIPEKEKAKKFKAYEPGYLHMDVTYLPQLDGKKWYLLWLLIGQQERSFIMFTTLKLLIMQ
ncbi:MAG: hypothetical protein WHT29_00395 [Bacteroidales bacterium]